MPDVMRFVGGGGVRCFAANVVVPGGRAVRERPACPFLRLPPAALVNGFGAGFGAPVNVPLVVVAARREGVCCLAA